jgi:hypothetical protein
MNISLLLLSSLAVGSIAAYIATRRARNPYIWFTVGFVFGLLGVLALFIIPYPRKKALQEATIRPAPQPFIDGPLDLYWYYLDEDRSQKGPVSRDALTRAWQSGDIGSSTFVWHEELPSWKPLQELIKFRD